jgi:Domain of unknown function (DUF4126)
VDEARLVELLPAVGMAIALAACAGVRAWLPLLLAGGLSRAGFLELGDSFAFLGSDRALMLFGLATLLEIAADKVPALDHALDALSTVLRPAAGALLAASVIGRFADPLTALALGVAVGAPASLVPHAAKSALRAVSSTLTAGLANPALSLIEDLLAVVMFALAILVPVAVVLLLLLALVLIARRVSRRPSPARA